MSYFKAKMHQIQFWLGLRPRPRGGGAYSAPPDLLAEFKGPTSKGREGRGGVGRERERRGRGGTPWFLLTPPDVKSWIQPWHHRQRVVDNPTITDITEYSKTSNNKQTRLTVLNPD